MKKLVRVLTDHNIIKVKQLSDNYSHLYSGYNIITQTDVVIKLYNNLNDFINEMTIMKIISVKNEKISKKKRHNKVPIPKVYEYVSYEKKKGTIHCLIMEKINTLDLMCHIENKSLNKLERFRIMKRLIEIINNLHKMKIVHRDIKCENILIKLPTNNIESKIDITLIDFAFSKCITNKKDRDMVGTMNYYSPELYFCKEYDSKANDVWSLGIIIYILASKGYYPFIYPEKTVNFWISKTPCEFQKKKRSKLKKYFYMYVVDKIRYDMINKDLAYILKKIFVPENVRIKTKNLKKNIFPILDKIIKEIHDKTNDDVINMSPGRHILHASV